MTEKRFTINMEYECIDDAKREIFIDFNDRIDFYELCEFLNKLVDENEQLKKELEKISLVNELLSMDLKESEHELWKENEQLKSRIKDYDVALKKLQDLTDKKLKEDKQLKQDNNVLIKMLENQSVIIQELHSKILEYELKEPIVLTKEDIEIMDKAISYYLR